MNLGITLVWHLEVFAFTCSHTVESWTLCSHIHWKRFNFILRRIEIERNIALFSKTCINKTEAIEHCKWNPTSFLFKIFCNMWVIRVCDIRNERRMRLTFGSTIFVESLVCLALNHTYRMSFLHQLIFSILLDYFTDDKNKIMLEMIFRLTVSTCIEGCSQINAAFRVQGSENTVRIKSKVSISHIAKKC